MSDHDQIADALRAHRSIKNPALKRSSIFLKRPAAPIKHKLQTHPLTEKEIELAAERRAKGEEVLKKREATGIKMLGRTSTGRTCGALLSYYIPKRKESLVLSFKRNGWRAQITRRCVKS